MKPAVEKLPLTTRKNLRDGWDNKKGEWEKKISDILGESWTLSTDPALVYANCQREDLLARIADALSWYVEAAISNFKTFKNEYGDEGVKELNDLVSKHEIPILPQDDTTFSYGGYIVKDGVLQLVFAEDNFATNVDRVSDKDSIVAAIMKAHKDGADGAVKSVLNIESRRDIRKYWDPNAEKIRKSIADQVKIPDIVLEPQWEQIVQALIKAYAPQDENEEYRMSRELNNNQKQLAQMGKLYFEALASQLKRDKFGSDDMLQEAFQEAVESKKIGLRIVDKLRDGRHYNDTVIEDGVMWMQTTPKEWRVNIDNIAEKLMELF